jgi:hypothetical protein
MKFSRKTYAIIAVVAVLVAIGAFLWYTSCSREGFTNPNIGDVVGKAKALSRDSDMLALYQANPGPKSAYFEDLRYHYPWFVIGGFEPAGKIKLSRVKAYLDGKVDFFPIFTVQTAKPFMDNPVFLLNCPFGGIGQKLRASPLVVAMWNKVTTNPALNNLKLVTYATAAIAVHNHASLLTKGTYDRVDFYPQDTAVPAWKSAIPMYTQQEKDLMLKIAPKILDIDDDTDPKIAFKAALSDAKTKSCVTGSYQGQTPTFTYNAGGSCTDSARINELRGKLQPAEAQSIITEVLALGPPPPPPPPPVIPTAAPVVPTPAPAPTPAPMPNEPSPTLTEPVSGPAPVASSSGAYAASCTRCTLLNNQLSCSCDVTAR